MSKYKVGQIVRITETNECMSDKFAYSGSYDLGDLVVVEDSSLIAFKGGEDCLRPWINSNHAEPTGFSVGDVVVAKEGTPYWYITDGWEGVIKDVSHEYIMVRDLDDDLIYPGDPEYFYKKEKVEPTPKTPTSTLLKTFGELSDEEKGALLLAAHEGKPLQYYYIDKWFDIDAPYFDNDLLCRITPNKVLEAREEKDRLESLVRNLEESLADTKDDLKDVSQTLRELNAV
jgi:hypothetical protein